MGVAPASHVAFSPRGMAHRETVVQACQAAQAKAQKRKTIVRWFAVEKVGSQRLDTWNRPGSANRGPHSMG